MLTVKEQQEVQGALADVLAQTDVRVFIQATFAPRHLEMLRELPNNLTLPLHHADFVLSYCLNSGWPPAPESSLLEIALTALVDDGHPGLAPARDRVRLGPEHDPTPDPVQTLWVRQTLPFFSREALRPIVTRLVANDAQPILRIRGPHASGKSYTRELLDHVSATRRDLRVVVAEVPKGTGPSYAPEELAETLVAPTTRDVATIPRRSTSNYAAALCRWVLNAAIQSPGRWIYVLDSFDQPDLQAETRELVQALARQIGGPGEFRKRMRLVLVDYTAPLPAVQAGIVLDDDVPDAAAVTSEHVAACLAAHYRDLAEQGRAKGTVTATELRTAARALLAEAALRPEPPLEALNTMLTRLRMSDLGLLAT